MKVSRIEISQLQEKAGLKIEIKGNFHDIDVTNPANFETADSHSLVFINNSDDFSFQSLVKTKARTIILKPELYNKLTNQDKRCYLITRNPKLAFTRIVKAFDKRRVLGYTSKGNNP